MDKKKILVVVDYQKDFVDGSLGFAGAEKLDEGIAALIREYMESDDIVIVTMDTHGTYMPYMESREGKALPVNHCQYLSDGWKLFGQTHDVIMEYCGKGTPPKKGCILFINKPTFATTSESIRDVLCGVGATGGMPAPFTKYELGADENNLPISEVRFVGLVADICVLSNIPVFQGLFPEAQMVLDAKLTASFDSRQYLNALEIAEKSWQVRVENKPSIYFATELNSFGVKTIPAGSPLVVRADNVYDACMRVGIAASRNIAMGVPFSHPPAAFYHFDDPAMTSQENAESIARGGWAEINKTIFWSTPVK